MLSPAFVALCIRKHHEVHDHELGPLIAKRRWTHLGKLLSLVFAELAEMAYPKCCQLVSLEESL